MQVQSALAQTPEAIRGAVLDSATDQLAPGWAEELSRGSEFSPSQRKIVTGGNRVIAHPMGMQIRTGSTKPFLTRAYEFGTLNREEKRTYTRRSRKGGTHQVTRRTKRQLPTRSQTGWIAYPAASRYGKRVFAMFQQIVVKFLHDGVEGKSS